MKQEFIIIRQFFFETSNALNKSQTKNRKFFVERTKQCYLQSYGLFDRVATFLKEYFELKLPKKVTESNVSWYLA
ncbi:LA2681 family HEPN domain-containing protein [Paenibacillus periandrae]|uniref:LA2681 family HEPN domain-containing protein n=1 Tax=Paenibacillus periandrae TaxID=1761741 RepID=UPI001F094E7E|nr:LA2681 family HEPN domain-containing protein [Paenibacillus periandrae]